MFDVLTILVTDPELPISVARVRAEHHNLRHLQQSWRIGCVRLPPASTATVYPRCCCSVLLCPTRALIIPGCWQKQQHGRDIWGEEISI